MADRDAAEQQLAGGGPSWPIRVFCRPSPLGGRRGDDGRVEAVRTSSPRTSARLSSPAAPFSPRSWTLTRL